MDVFDPDILELVLLVLLVLLDYDVKFDFLMVKILRVPKSNGLTQLSNVFVKLTVTQSYITSLTKWLSYRRLNDSFCRILPGFGHRLSYFRR